MKRAIEGELSANMVRALVCVACLNAACHSNGGGALGTGGMSGTGGTAPPRAQQLLVPKSGSRLKVRSSDLGDGVKYYVGMFDSVLNDNCSWWNVEEGGTYRCVPGRTSTSSELLYQDPACSKAVGRFEKGCDRLDFVVRSDPNRAQCSFAQLLYRVTETILPSTAPVFESRAVAGSTERECRQLEQSDATDIVVLEALPWSTLQVGGPDGLPVQDVLRPTVIKADDGSSSVAGYIANQGRSYCQEFTLADGKQHCVTGRFAVFEYPFDYKVLGLSSRLGGPYFSDDECKDELAVSTKSTCDPVPPAFALKYELTCPRQVRILDVLERTEALLKKSPTPPVCGGTSSPSTNVEFYRVAEGDPSRWPSFDVLETSVLQGRATLLQYSTKDYRWQRGLTKADGTPCSFQLKDGQWQCMPAADEYLASLSDAYADPACTQHVQLYTPPQSCRPTAVSVPSGACGASTKFIVDGEPVTEPIYIYVPQVGTCKKARVVSGAYRLRPLTDADAAFSFAAPTHE